MSDRVGLQRGRRDLRMNGPVWPAMDLSNTAPLASGSCAARIACWSPRSPRFATGCSSRPRLFLLRSVTAEGSRFFVSDGFSVFETAHGFCAIVWGEKGVRRLLLPARSRVEIERH